MKIGGPAFDDIGHHLPEGNRVGGTGADALPGRLAHRRAHPQGHQQARHPHDEEGELPAVHLPQHGHLDGAHVLHQGHNGTAQDVGKPRAQRYPDHVNAQGAGQERFREVVADHGIGSRPQRRLPHADAHPGQEQRPEVFRQPAERRHRAPHGNAGNDEIAAVPAVGDARQRQTHDGVEQREGETGQQAVLGVGDLEGFAHGADQQPHDHAVEESKDLRDEQHSDHIPGIQPAAVVHGGMSRPARRVRLRRSSAPN